MTDAPDDAAAVRRALADRDLDRAVTASRRLADASLTELLSDLATAVEDGRTEDVETLLATVEERYETVRSEQAATTAAVEAAMNADPGEISHDDRRRLSVYHQTVAATNLERAGTLAGVRSFVEGEAENGPDSGSLAESIRSTKDTEATVADETTTAEETVATVPLGASVVVTDVSFDREPAGVGDTVSLSVGITNVGEEAATGVTATLELPSGLSTPDPKLAFGNVGAGATTTESVDVTTEERGSFTLTVGASADNGGVSSRTETYRVVESSEVPAGPVERADTNDDGKISTEELQAAIQGWATGEYTTSELQRIIQAWVTS